MSETLIIGMDGHASGDRALEYGEHLASLIKDCQLSLVYVIEWSPYSFQTAEENAERHKRREEEISLVLERIIDPALSRLKAAGVKATGLVRHGDVADTLKAVSTEEGASHIIVGRSSEGGFSRRVFGSSTGTLVMSADVPVTVVK